MLNNFISRLTSKNIVQLPRRLASAANSGLDGSSSSKSPSNTGDKDALTKTKEKSEWPETEGVGYVPPYVRDRYLNPLLTPPPRSPQHPEDFRNPQKLGHWVTHGFDFTSPQADNYRFHEFLFFGISLGILTLFVWAYGPDYKLLQWSQREAYLRTYKREALGQPLIDKNVVDPDRIVLPTEEELGDYPIYM